MIWLTFIATLAVLCALATNSRPLLITTTACLLGALLGILAAIVVSGLQQVNCCRIPLRHGCIVLPLSCCVSSPSPQMHTAGPLFPCFSSRLALCSCQFYYSYTPSEGLLCQAWWTATGHTSVRRISVLANNRCRLVYGVVAMVTITCSAGSFCSWRVSYCPCTRSGPPFLDSTHPVCIVLCCGTKATMHSFILSPSSPSSLSTIPPSFRDVLDLLSFSPLHQALYAYCGCHCVHLQS